MERIRSRTAQTVLPAAAPLRRTLTFWLLALLTALAGCATTGPGLPIDASHLPPPDSVIEISGLTPCTAETDPRVRLNRAAPVAILVHGYRGAPAYLRPLAQELADRGLQTVCFEYDDREMLITSAIELTRTIDALAAALVQPRITVVGHSQGGLIARKALVNELPKPVQAVGARVHLVTVATPFAGTASARLCASTTARVMTLGLGDLVCRLISGKKWYEITHASDFIREPGTLVDMVREHLMIITDEADSCRRFDARGACTVGDYVIGVREQRFPPVEAEPRAKRVLVKAGHLEIVGESGGSAGKLVAVLERYALVAPAPTPAPPHLVARSVARSGPRVVAQSVVYSAGQPAAR